MKPFSLVCLLATEALIPASSEDTAP